MIAYIDTYGKKLVITKDTVVTYTLEENRKIAIVFKQGEYDAAMSKHLQNIVFTQDTIIDGLRTTIYTLQDNFGKLKESIGVLEAENETLLKELRKQLRQHQTFKKLAWGSLGLNVLFIIIIAVL